MFIRIELWFKDGVLTIPEMMHAAVYRGVNDVRVETVPVPKIGKDEILVKVAVCGVCPTDIKKIQYGTVPPPRIFGHETAGTIVQVGSKVHGFSLGERVALHHHIPCLKCHACRHQCFAQCSQYKRTGVTAGFEPAGGGFAEYVRVMSFVLPGVVKIPARNTFEEGAMLEPVNTVLKAIKRMNLLPGDSVWVAGQGPVGLIFTRLLSLHGIRVIASDLLASRLRLARRFGATQTISADKAGFSDYVSRATNGKGIDGVVVAVPSDTVVSEAISRVRDGGKILLFAHTKPKSELSVDLSAICVSEKDLIGSYSADFTLQSEVARLVFSRRLDVRTLLTDRFPLGRVNGALDRATRPTKTSLKVLVCA